MIRNTVLFIIILLSGCAQQQPNENQNLTPEIIQNVETTSEQELLFGHYENVNTVYGGSYKGCCVFNKERMKLAHFAIDYFEAQTGEEFGDRDMLIGTTNDKVLVYIKPSASMRKNTSKTYYMQINKASAEVEAFKLREEVPN